MIEIDKAIKVLEQGSLASCEADAKEFCEAYEYAINNLKLTEWLINEYEHEVDLLEQDLNSDDVKGYARVVCSTKLAVCNQFLKYLKAEDVENVDE